MIYFWKDDCKIIFDEGQKLKFWNRFAMLLSVNLDLASLAVMLATWYGFWNVLVFIWSFMENSNTFTNVRCIFIYILFCNAVFERAIYYLFILSRGPIC